MVSASSRFAFPLNMLKALSTTNSRKTAATAAGANTAKHPPGCQRRPWLCPRWTPDRADCYRRTPVGARDEVMKRSVVLLVMVFLVLAGAPAARADPPAEAEELIRAGVALRKQGEDAAALAEFQRAYALDPSPRAAGQMGFAEQALGHWLDAEIHLGEALAGATHPWVQKNRAIIEGSLRVVKGRVGRLAVNGTPAGAEVTVNGRRAGLLPLRAPVRVQPGAVRVEVRAQGHAASILTVSVPSGRQIKVDVRLQKERAGAPAEAVAPVTPASPPRPAALDPAASPSPPPPEPKAPATPAPLPPPLIVNVQPASSSPPPVVLTAPPPDPSATPVSKRDGRGSVARPTRWALLGGAALFLGAGTVAVLMHERSISDFNDPGKTCRNNGGVAIDTRTLMPDPSCQSLLDNASTQKKVAWVGFAGAGVLAITSAVLFFTF